MTTVSTRRRTSRAAGRTADTSSRRRSSVFEEDDAAFVTYQCVTTDGKYFRNTEFFTFAGDRIASVSVYFGATYRDGVLVT
jgi:hypothetical protein